MFARPGLFNYALAVQRSITRVTWRVLSRVARERGRRVCEPLAKNAFTNWRGRSRRPRTRRRRFSGLARRFSRNWTHSFAPGPVIAANALTVPAAISRAARSIVEARSPPLGLSSSIARHENEVSPPNLLIPSPASVLSSLHLACRQSELPSDDIK